MHLAPPPLPLPPTSLPSFGAALRRLQKLLGRCLANILTEEKSSLIYVCVCVCVHMYVQECMYTRHRYICLCFAAAPCSRKGAGAGGGAGSGAASLLLFLSFTFCCLYFRLDCHLISLLLPSLGWGSVWLGWEWGRGRGEWVYWQDIVWQQRVV